MFYSNGNYEAFIRPRKPQGVDEKSAYLIGGGIASLAAAGFLIRDGQMDGKRITIYEASKIAGGCLDGIKDPKEGYIFRGEREMEDHYECLWDSDALDPVARCRGRLGPRRLLPGQQGPPQLLPVPDHSQARAALPDRRQDAPHPQGAG